MKRFYLTAFLALLCAVFLQAQVTEEEFQALKALYNATDGDNWTDRTGWVNINTTATKDDVTTDWFGLNVYDGHVIKIILASNNLNGNIPNEIGAFEYMTILNLGANKISGVIPSEFGNLDRLEQLDIERNSLSGALPSEIKNMSALEQIRLSLNKISKLPMQLPPKLFRLEIAYNEITGVLPDIFGKMDLRVLGLYGNKFTGELPKSISELKSLQHLQIGDNSFSGELPTLDSCENLRTISVYNNNFTGTIPESYGNFLFLDEFEIYGNNLHGEVPVALAENVEFIKLRNNYFTFQAVEPILSSFFYANDYTPQKEVPLSQKTFDVDFGTQLTLDAGALAQYELGSNNNRYKWYFNGNEVYSGNSPVYTAAEADASHAGEYYFKVTNTVVTELTLTSEKITVSVIGGNEAPTDISLSSTSVDENFTGVVGTLSAVDNNSEDTFTYSMASGDGNNDKDNSKFSIEGSDLKVSTKLDYETTKSCFVCISVNDGNGGIYTKDFEIVVNNVDEAPVWSMGNTSVYIDENAENGSDIFTLSANDPEGSVVTCQITEGDPDGAFKIANSKLQVADNTKLDYDVKKQYIITVVASDGSFYKGIQLTINLNKINQPPEIDDFSFDIDENLPAGTVVGVLEASDPDDETLTFTLKGDDSNSFELIEKTLKVKTGANLDYETKNAYVFQVEVSDGVSNVSAAITITLNDVEETTTVNNVNITDYKIYPNPVKSRLYVSASVQPERIKVMSLNGQVILVVEPYGMRTEVDMEVLKPGMYFVEIIAGQNSLVKKIIKL